MLAPACLVARGRAESHAGAENAQKKGCRGKIPVFAPKNRACQNQRNFLRRNGQRGFWRNSIRCLTVKKGLFGGRFAEKRGLPDNYFTLFFAFFLFFGIFSAASRCG